MPRVFQSTQRHTAVEFPLRALTQARLSLKTKLQYRSLIFVTRLFFTRCKLRSDIYSFAFEPELIKIATDFVYIFANSIVAKVSRVGGITASKGYSR